MYAEQILDYYSRKDVQKAILESAGNREVVPIVSSGGFGSRPNAVFYPKDVEQLIKQGAISFHGSIERWKNPLSLRTEMRKEELDALRIGWDLVIDIDPKPRKQPKEDKLYDAKNATLAVIKVLEDHGILHYSIKYSGNKGFHIGVPFEAFPSEIMSMGRIEKKFPEIPNKILQYIKDRVAVELRNRLKETKIVKQKFPFKEYKTSEIPEIDIALATSRHLIRLPYCLHRKTWLVSVPLTKSELEGFEKEQAKPENVKVKTKFLEPVADKNEALELLRPALYWSSKKGDEKKVDLGEMQLPAAAIKPNFFPPCMKNILAGLSDGRKRSIFILITFLHHMGWPREDIGKLLYSWNQKNNPPLKETLIKVTFNNQYSRSKPQMAPNCNNFGYYVDYGACTPDEFCKKINNPVTYTLSKVKSLRRRRRRPRRKHKKTKKQKLEEKNG